MTWKYILRPKILLSTAIIQSATIIEITTNIQITGADLTTLNSTWTIIQETNIN